MSTELYELTRIDVVSGADAGVVSAETEYAERKTLGAEDSGKLSAWASPTGSCCTPWIHRDQRPRMAMAARVRRIQDGDT